MFSLEKKFLHPFFLVWHTVEMGLDVFSGQWEMKKKVRGARIIGWGS